MTLEVVPVVTSVVRDPQVVRDPDFVLQDPKLKTLESRGRRQVFPTHTHTHTHTQRELERSASYKSLKQKRTRHY